MIDPAVLQGFFNAQTTLALSSRRAGTGALASSSAIASGVVPPWDPNAAQPRETERLIAALRTEKFVDFEDASFDREGVPEDHKKLFGLYKALNTLSIIANEAADKDTSATRLSGYDRRFQIGLAQFTDALASTSFDALTLMTGKKSDYMESPLAVPRDRSQFATRALRVGDPNLALENITGTESFTIRVRKNNVDTDVLVDFSALAGPPTISNIAKLMNDSLAAAGMVTRVTRGEVGVAEGDAPRKWGLKIEGVSTEALSFIPAAANPAIYAVAAIGTGETAGARIAKLADNGSATPDIINTSSISAEGGAFVPVTAKTDSDGNVFVLGTTGGSSGTQVLQGEKDLMLRKLDSAGNVLWTKLLGTSDRAEAAALAVDSEGGVIVAGRINGKIDGSANGGGWDSVVAKFDSEGEEIFLRQNAPIANDEATSIAVAADGSIFIGGVTSAKLSGVATHGGGTDAYVTRLTADGALVWNRQLGGTGNERVARLSFADDGQLLVATSEDGVARLAKYDVSSAASAATWDVSLGALSGGAISALAARDGKIYVAGYTSNSAFDAGGLAATNAHNGGVDGFVMTLTDDGASVTPVDTNYIGSDNTDRIRDIAVTDGAIYVTGETDNHLPGQTTAPEGGKSAFVTKIPLDASSSFTHYFGGPGGTGGGAAIVVDETGSSVLDALGLPRGELDYTPARTLTARTTARPGDWFTIAVDGGRERRITIREGETVRSLVNKINRVLVLDGKASVKRGADGDQLRITAREGSIIDIKAGADGFDALKGLGLQPGKIVAAAKLSSSGLDDEEDESETDSAEAEKEEEKATDNIFGLGLTSGLSLLSRENAAAANDAIRDAMSVIRKAYREITRDPDLDALLERRSGGTVPAYMRAQLGNYQAGLARLQAGGGSTGGLF